jgi:DNA polymerase-3 subunit epsilon
MLSEAAEEPMNFVAIDFETANYQARSACSVGLVKVVGGEIVDTAVHFIRPPTREFVFTYIHGLTWKDVAKSDDFGKLWPTLESFFDGAQFIAAHNAPFDKGVLHACCAHYGIAAPSLAFHCTVQIARRAWNIYPTKLPNVCRYLGIDLNHHEALSDAVACARIVLAANEKKRANVASPRRDDARRPSARMSALNRRNHFI